MLCELELARRIRLANTKRGDGWGHVIPIKILKTCFCFYYNRTPSDEEENRIIQIDTHNAVLDVKSENHSMLTNGAQVSSKMAPRC